MQFVDFILTEHWYRVLFLVVSGAAPPRESDTDPVQNSLEPPTLVVCEVDAGVSEWRRVVWG
jgi:hypothetical protein